MYLANVIFWGEKKGGRFTPPKSGFNPQIQIGEVKTSCYVSALNDIETFEFENIFKVKLELMYPNEYEGQLKIGDQIRFYEGNKQIGEGEILDVT